MLEKSRNVLVLAGYGDEAGKEGIEFATKLWDWKRHGIDVTAYNVGWRDQTEAFDQKLQEITNLVETLSKKGPVSIIGISAGASAAFNAFLHRPDVIRKVVGICGPFRLGEQWAHLRDNPGRHVKFVQSVLMFEQQESGIVEELKKRMMTVSPKYGDWQIPEGTMHVEGAHNIQIPTMGHNFSIGLALTLFKKPIIDFITLEEENK